MNHKRYIGERRSDGGGMVFVADTSGIKRLLDPRHDLVRFSEPPLSFDWHAPADLGGTFQLAFALLVDALTGARDPNWEIVAADWCPIVAAEQLAPLPYDGFELGAWALRRWLAEQRSQGRQPLEHRRLELPA